MSEKAIRLMQGNEAIAEGALAAGARFYAGYPITPSTEVAEAASVRMPRVGGMYVQMEDEIGSIAVVIGASAAGKKAFTATSGPGFSLMQENLGVAVMAEIPCVIVNVQRSGPSTGLATKPAQGDLMQSRWGTHADHGVIVLSPSSVQDCYDLTVRAFALAEAYRTPVVLLADEAIGHLKERVHIRPPEPADLPARPQNQTPDPAYRPFGHRPGSLAPLLPYGGPNLVRLSGTMHDEAGYPCTRPDNADFFIRHYVDKIERDRDRIGITRAYALEDAEVAIVSFGCSARSALGAMELLRARGVRAGVFQPVTLWPFPGEAIEALTGRVRAVVVPELNLGQLRGEILKHNPAGVPVLGVNRVDSALIEPEEIATTVEEALA